MYFLALATNYDGTLASQGIVDRATPRALEEFRSTGRRLILVTGRELPHLEQAFPEIDIFDMMVAENGALIIILKRRKSAPSAPLLPPCSLNGCERAM